MAYIIITGHKNPDMDSVCSAWCYAELKNKIDPENSYVPGRCGSLNMQTKAAFKKAGIDPPSLIKDVSPKVSDVTRRDIVSLEWNEPIFNAIKVLDNENISCIPVFNDRTEFTGIITTHQITSFLISENLGKRPAYSFRINNFQKVLPGYFYKIGENKEFTAPIMTGAMPVDVSRERIESLKPDKPVLVVGLREDIIKTAVVNNFPAVILTGIEDSNLPINFDNYKGTVFVSKSDTAETIRLLRLSAPLKEIMNKNPEIIQADTDFDKAKNLLVNSKYRGLPVFKENDFTGIVTRRCFIEKPLKKIIMVDHNETAQSVRGADQAEIVEIIDHHRLSPQPTHKPIYMSIRPVGSTCTIITGMFETHGIEISRQTAILLLSGIISDTVILKSPTTTAEDKAAAEKLSKICLFSIEDYGRELQEQSAVLEKTSPHDLINSDLKEYNHGNFTFAVGQAEVINLEGVNRMKADLLNELNIQKSRRKLDWAMLLITDVIKEVSVLVAADLQDAEDQIIYKKIEENLFYLPGILSRKKQLLPELLRVIEDAELSKK